MVQLTMLGELEEATLDAAVAALGQRAYAAGAGRAIAGIAARATKARFGSEVGEMSLTSNQMRRVRDYHNAVLRREVFRNGARESAAYRERLRVRAAVDDLLSAGVRGARLRAELVETLGMDAKVVDVVLGALRGAA